MPTCLPIKGVTAWLETTSVYVIWCIKMWFYSQWLQWWQDSQHINIHFQFLQWLNRGPLHIEGDVVRYTAHVGFAGQKATPSPEECPIQPWTFKESRGCFTLQWRFVSLSASTFFQDYCDVLRAKTLDVWFDFGLGSEAGNYLPHGGGICSVGIWIILWVIRLLKTCKKRYLKYWMG